MCTIQNQFFNVTYCLIGINGCNGTFFVFFVISVLSKFLRVVIVGGGVLSSNDAREMLHLWQDLIYMEFIQLLSNL